MGGESCSRVKISDGQSGGFADEMPSVKIQPIGGFVEGFLLINSRITLDVDDVVTGGAASSMLLKCSVLLIGAGSGVGSSVLSMSELSLSGV